MPSTSEMMSLYWHFYTVSVLTNSFGTVLPRGFFTITHTYS
jgi:hypothetical protein